MPFNLTRLSGPAREPFTVTEVKDYLRIDGTDQDFVLSGLIASARSAAELYLRRCLLPQRWRLTLDRFPGSWPYTYGYGMVQSPKREIHLPLCPLISIDAFTFPDPGTLQPIDAMSWNSIYSTGSPVYNTPHLAATPLQVVFAEPARIQPPYGTAWPIAAWTIGDIHVDFTAGYLDVQSSPSIGSVPMPPEINTAMLWMIGHWYENRESQEIPKGAENLLQPHRVWDVAPVADNWGRFAR